MTAFADIVAAFVERLQSAPAVSDMVLRANDRRVPENKAAAVNVYHAASTPIAGAIHGAPIDWTTGIVVECFAKTITETPDVPVDRLMSAVYSRLAADSTLGGLVDDIGVPSLQFDYDGLGQRTGWVVMRYSVQHRTCENTLDSRHE